MAARRRLVRLCFVAFALALGCAASTDDPGRGRHGPEGSTGASAHGTDGTDGAGSPDRPDDPAGLAGAGAEDAPKVPIEAPADECGAVEAEAQNVREPADIIFVVDNAMSMGEEESFVQNQLNLFASSFGAAGVDVHVVVITESTDFTAGFCAPAPLGSGVCPEDTNLPLYMRLDYRVAGTTTLDLVLRTWPRYLPVLRPGAKKHVVVVSDGNAMMASAAFDTAFRQKLLELDPGNDAYTFHAIYAFSDGGAAACSAGDACCGIASAEGTVYRELVALRAGIEGDLCEQDFAPVFDELARAVTHGSQLECEWTIPAPPDGKTVDPMKVNLAYETSPGMPTAIGSVDGAAGCTPGLPAWHFDDAVIPSKVIACPDTCATLRAAAYAKVTLAFGCERKIARPE